MAMSQTIDEVLQRLDEIISECITGNNRMGYFSALYRKVTQSVKDHIEQGYFENNERMERLDVVFANRYLKAYDQYLHSEACTNAWQVAFDGSKNKKLIVLQHLFLGMNAHINLDLGIAAAAICPGPQIASLKNDFFSINDILASLVNKVQDELAKIWPFLKVIDKVAGKLDEGLADFSMTIARDGAWKVAKDLALLDEKQRTAYIVQLDKRVAPFGSGIANPGFILGLVTGIVRMGENKNVAQNIEILNQTSETVKRKMETN